jgi:hypothetical protein
MVLFSALLFVGAIADASDLGRPAPQPCKAKPLSEIIQILECQGYPPIVGMEFENDYWEVEAYRGNTLVEVRVHPATGMILQDTPPTGQIPIAEVVKRLEHAGYQVVMLELEGSEWQIEAYRRKSVAVRIDPLTGGIQEIPDGV